MKKRLSLKVLVPLILFTLIPGILLTGLAEWLTEGLLIDHFLQRGIELGRHINEEFYDRYFNPRYEIEIEKEAFNPLDPRYIKELDTLIRYDMRHFHAERVNFFSQTGQVIYSTEKSLVGTDASSIPQVQQALRGQVTSRVVYGFRPDRLHGKAATLLNHDVIEVYLPMLCLNEKLPIYGQQIGVLELYQNINVVRQWINKIRLYLGVMLSLILAVLIVSASSALHLAALRPIRQMVDTIMDPNAIVEGRLVKRIEGGTTYELQVLANSFNRMVVDIGLAYEQERRLKGQLQVLHDAAMALSADLSLEVVLQQIMVRARELCGARYAALLLADASGGLTEFLTAGITPEQQAAIGQLPQGLGLLGAVLQEGEMLSLRDIREDPRSVGFPSGHPLMASFLGVPIASRGRVLGALYLADKVGAEEFLPEDRELISRFSAHAAIAIENATLYGQVEERARELSQQVAVQSQYAEVVLRSIADGIYSTDLEKHIQSWSRGAEAITGFKEEEALGQRCQDFLHHCDDKGKVLCDMGECPISQTLQQGQPASASEVWFHTRSGERVPISLVASPIFDPQGKVTGAVEVFHDVSQERELIESIQRANRAKSEFLANMSHELRTPLTAIIGFSELLHKGLLGELNPKQAEYVGDILNSGRHLLSLINDILDLSKVEAEEMELELAEVSLKSLLETGLMMVRQRALKHGIALSLSVEEELDTLVADERKVKQVLFNLLSNAVKFTPDGGRVGVEVRRQGDWVTLTVWDTGIGISFQDQRRLFQPFQQIDSSLDRRYEGTGLGLALTKKLVELHGGKIWVESTPEEGSRFIFTLPLQGREVGFPSLPNQNVILPYASFCRHLERLVNMAKRQGRELALIQLKLGEAGGNAGELKDSLGAVVAAIQGRMRSYDVMGRGEGEPALFLALPDTPLPHAQEVGLRCRALLEEEGIRAEIQVAGYPKDAETVEGLIRAIVR